MEELQGVHRELYSATHLSFALLLSELTASVRVNQPEPKYKNILG
jgi:hypothetical protein